MLALLPPLLFVLTALAIILWQRIRPGFGAPWLLAAGAAFAVWGLLLWLRFRLPIRAVVSSWQPLGEVSEFPFFQLDNISWAYAIALAGLVLAVLLTASARLAYQTNPYAWASSLFIAGAGFLAVLAANPLTLAVAWVLIDLIELVIMLATVQQSDRSRQVTLAFAVRVIGVWFLIWSILRARSIGITLTFAQVPPEVAFFLLVAAGLRLGVLPLHLPYIGEIPMRRGVGNVLRMVGSLTSLVLLARLPAGAVPPAWTPWLLALTALSAVYGSFMWLFSRDELSARPYWLITLGAFAVTGVIRGQPEASLAWGLALILPGGLLFLYSARQSQVFILPLLGGLGLLGITFTPAVLGWQGIWVAPFSFLNLLFLLAHVLLVAGYLRHAFAPGDSLSSMDRWIQGMYPFGLFLLVVTHWLAAYFSLPATFTLIFVWQGLVSILVALLGMYVVSRGLGSLPTVRTGWLAVLARRAGGAMAAVLSLNWLYRLAEWVYAAGQRIIRLATAVLEGDGGVLWAILLLILLISILRQGGVR